jgi:hypothetical protein
VAPLVEAWGDRKDGARLEPEVTAEESPSTAELRW